jgi:hypothetical protein
VPSSGPDDKESKIDDIVNDNGDVSQDSSVHETPNDETTS